MECQFVSPVTWYVMKGHCSSIIVYLLLFFCLMACTAHLFFPMAIAGCVYLHSKFQWADSNWYLFAGWHKPSAPKKPSQTKKSECFLPHNKKHSANSPWHVTKRWCSLRRAQVTSCSLTAGSVGWAFNTPQTHSWHSICRNLWGLVVN